MDNLGKCRGKRLEDDAKRALALLRVIELIINLLHSL